MFGEIDSINEQLKVEERRAKIATFISDTIKPARKTLNELENQQNAVNDFESREYQLEAWDALWQARSRGQNKGLLHLATGLGKTSVAVFDYARFRSERQAEGKSARGLFVVHQNNILDQASERFGEILPEISRSRSIKGLIDSETDMAFISFQTLTRSVASIPSDAFDYIIYDEAHHIEAKTYKKVVEHFKPVFQLGLTATPERLDRKDITNHFGTELYRKTLPEAIAEGHLATVNYNIVTDNAVQEAIKNNFNPSSVAEIQRLFDIQPRNEVIVEKINEAKNYIKSEQNVELVKTIIFCSNLDHANEIADLLNGSSYHSGKNSEIQGSILKSFRSDNLETITVRDMFNEGVDIPDARLIVFLRTTQSPAIFEQQLGRGLRKNSSKQEVTVLDFVANIERISLIRDLVDNVKQAKKTGFEDDDHNGEEPTSGVQGGVITTHSEESEFVFSEEVIDLLAKYNAIIDANKEKIDWSIYTNDEIIKLALQIQPDSPLTTIEIDELSKDGRFPSSPTIRKRFSSIPNFIKECGFQYIDWDEASDEELITKALELSPHEPLAQRTIKKLPNGVFPANTYIASRFGSLRAFQELCGFEFKKRGLSQSEIVELALEISPTRALNTPTINELSKQQRFPSLPTIMDKFGSLEEFYRQCGFTNINWSQATNEELVERALELSSDKPLNITSMLALSKERKFLHPNTVRQRFGSIEEFQRACGFEGKTRMWGHVTNDELILKADQLSPGIRLGIVAIDKLDRNIFPSSATIIKRFGSMPNWHKARGL